jgi:hypothetical protein
MSSFDPNRLSEQGHLRALRISEKESNSHERGYYKSIYEDENDPRGIVEGRAHIMGEWVPNLSVTNILNTPYLVVKKGEAILLKGAAKLWSRNNSVLIRSQIVVIKINPDTGAPLRNELDICDWKFGNDTTIANRISLNYGDKNKKLDLVVKFKKLGPYFFVLKSEHGGDIPHDLRSRRFEVEE